MNANKIDDCKLVGYDAEWTLLFYKIHLFVMNGIQNDKLIYLVVGMPIEKPR